MSFLEAIILGIIQGLTEFFPVSSSGHLMLAEYWMGLEDAEALLLFNVFCHVGTLASIFWVFWNDLMNILKKDKKTILKICLATLPLFPCVLLLKPLKELFAQPELLGYFFCMTAGILFLGQWLILKKTPHTFLDPFCIGCVQTIALLPGVSRSGSSITAARLLGWAPEEAVKFSFLIAIPAILGSVTLEVKDVLQKGLIPDSTLIFGAVTAFVAGVFALSIVKRLGIKGDFRYFAWYCLVLGLCLTLIF